MPGAGIGRGRGIGGGTAGRGGRIIEGTRGFGERVQDRGHRGVAEAGDVKPLVVR